MQSAIIIISLYTDNTSIDLNNSAVNSRSHGMVLFTMTIFSICTTNKSRSIPFLSEASLDLLKKGTVLVLNLGKCCYCTVLRRCAKDSSSAGKL